ncbi:MAG TPA: hypothetical protein VFI09_08175 [Solirubrobacterales bacterium]|nr:hypothetical protein [Solirubrobacterales bacterium]
MTKRKLGPEARRAFAAPIEGSKRRKVLILIAAYLDAGRPDPSISELAARARLRRLAVVAIVDRLERDGWLGVERAPRRRNVYRLLDGRGRR